MSFHSFDLEFDPMSLVLRLDLDGAKMYSYTQNKIPSCSNLQVIAQNRQIRRR